MTWFWLNIPLSAVFFLAISAIPFWMVIRHPDDRPARADAAGTSATGGAGSVLAAGMAQRSGHRAQTGYRRDLTGASAGDRG